MFNSQIKTLILLCAVLAAPLMAQVKFSRQIPISTRGDSMVALVTGDMNGDGKEDLVCAAMDDHELQWYPNLGGGNYGDRHTIAAGTVDGPRSLKLADIDGDNDLDVVACNSWDGKTYWYENTGFPDSFGHHPISTETQVKHVSIGDLDNDGDVDLMFCETSQEKVLVFLNDGSGGFGAATTVANPSGDLMTTHVADLDGDSKLDFVMCVDTANQISWCKGNGNGTFGAPQLITSAVSKPELVASADFDGDGDLDLASASNGDNKIAWYANDGSGSFGAQQVITTSATSATWLSLGDFDGDGDTDICSCGEGANNTVAWYENTGGGTFGGLNHISSTLTGPDGCDVSDVDGDGDVDILAVSWYLDRVSWFENMGGPAKAIAPQSTLSNIQNSVWRACSADFNNDGIKDVAFCSNNSGGSITWLKGLGGGEFEDERSVGQAVSAPLAIAAGDMDADGDADILVGANGGLFVFINDGTATFTGPNTLISGGHMDDIELVDIDADGDLDVLMSNNYGDYAVYALPNLGGWSFGTYQTVHHHPAPALQGSYSMAVGWLDGGPRPMVVTADGDSNKLKIHYNHSGAPAGWASVPLDLSLSGQRDVILSDLDGDGYNDVVVLSDSGMVWYKNNQDPTNLIAPAWVKTTLSTSLSNPRSVASSDIDGDGDEDLVVVSNLVYSFQIPAGNAVVWFENLGGANFAPAAAISKWPAEASFVTALDLDGDVDDDILVTCPEKGRVSWFENRSLAQHLGGSGADLTLGVGVAGAAATSWPPRRPISGGQTALVDFRSPGHTYETAAPLLAVQPYPHSYTLVPNTTFPELVLSPYSAAQYPIIVVYDGNVWAGAGVQGTLPPNGVQFSFTVPASLAGLDIRMQGFSMAPNPGNPIFTVTTGVELRIL